MERDCLEMGTVSFGLCEFVNNQKRFPISAQNPIIQTRYTADPAPMMYNDTVFLYTTHDEDDACPGRSYFCGEMAVDGTYVLFIRLTYSAFNLISVYQLSGLIHSSYQW